jgi:hypothetical protein
LDQDNVLIICIEEKMAETVILETKSLSEVFSLNLRIPDYQRVYCWTEKNVMRLLDDIRNLTKEYRLGTIILQKKTEYYDIIDGQQRLVTLSLILNHLSGGSQIPLLNECFENDEACQYIAYNKYLIEENLGNIRRKITPEDLLVNLSFNVLTLNDSSLELAYTFFSNENSKGCPLGDFDLLKAHHLRYVGNEHMAKDYATSWDSLILKGQDKARSERNYERSLALYIFRLRKWLNYDDWEESEKFRVKNEFEAARSIYNISAPTCDGQLLYKDPIEGGGYFFEYVSVFSEKYDAFSETKEYQALHHTLVGETHVWFRDVIECLLFAYYLKFEEHYLSDALALIARTISQARYESSRIYKESIFEYAKESKIAIMIDRNTSPSFLLAELEERARRLYGYPPEADGIRQRYHKLIQKLEHTIADRLTINLSGDMES